VTRTRWLVLVVVLLALLFAVQGGEYSTGDWLTLRRQVADRQASLEQLRHDIDSLQVLAKQVETDPAVQERIAREEFGMIRPGEIQYQILTPDTAGRP
jgi:cell division protein FtsB